MIYNFFWDDGKENELVEIKSTTAVAEEPEAIQKLLDEYRSSDENYNIGEFSEFLKKKGYRVRIIEADYSLYF